MTARIITAILKQMASQKGAANMPKVNNKIDYFWAIKYTKTGRYRKYVRKIRLYYTKKDAELDLMYLKGEVKVVKVDVVET